MVCMRRKKRDIRYAYIPVDNLGMYTIHTCVGDRDEEIEKKNREKNEQERKRKSKRK